jgi:uncharacterized phage-associated protein
MAYDARAVANEFLKRAKDQGKSLTPMQLVKLVYIAHGYSLALNNEPLIDSEVEAWKYGPVVPQVYRAFKSYGSDPVTGYALDYSLQFDQIYPFSLWDPFNESEEEQALDTIQQVWEKYGEKSGVELSRLTHNPNTPWYLVTNGGKKIGVNTEIPDDIIRDHYQQLVAENL